MPRPDPHDDPDDPDDLLPSAPDDLSTLFGPSGELRLDQALAAARALTPEDVTAASAAVLIADGDVVRQIEAVTRGKDPFSAFVVGILVGRVLTRDQDPRPRSGGPR